MVTVEQIFDEIIFYAVQYVVVFYVVTFKERGKFMLMGICLIRPFSIILRLDLRTIKAPAVHAYYYVSMTGCFILW